MILWQKKSLKEKLKLKAYANCIKTDFQIVSNFETNETLDNKFFILDEITYIYHAFLSKHKSKLFYILFERLLCPSVLRLRFLQSYVPLRGTIKRKRPREHI